MSFFTEENSRQPLFSTPQTPIRRDTATSTETLNDNCCGCGTWSSSKKSKIGKSGRPLQIKSRKQLFSRVIQGVNAQILSEEQESQAKTPSVHDPDKTSDNSTISSSSTGVSSSFFNKCIADQKPIKNVILENTSVVNNTKGDKNKVKKSSQTYPANSSQIAGSNVELNAMIVEISNCSSISWEFTDETGAVYNSPDLQESYTLVENTLKRSISSEIERNRMASCSPHLNIVQNLDSVTGTADTSMKSLIYKVSPPAPANTPENSLTSSGDSRPLVAPANTLDIVTNSSSSLAHPSSSDSHHGGIVNNIQNVTISHTSGELPPTYQHHDALLNENRSRNSKPANPSSLNVEKSSKKVSKWLRQIDSDNHRGHFYREHTDDISGQMSMSQEANLVGMKVSDFDTPSKNARLKMSTKRRHYRHHHRPDDEVRHQKTQLTPDYRPQRDGVNVVSNHQLYSETPLRTFFPPIINTPLSNISYLQASSIPIPIYLLPTNPVVIGHPSQQHHLYANTQPPPPPSTPISSNHHRHHYQPRNPKPAASRKDASQLAENPATRQTPVQNKIKIQKTCNKPGCKSAHVNKKTAVGLQRIRKLLKRRDRSRDSSQANNSGMEVKTLALI